MASASFFAGASDTAIVGVGAGCAAGVVLAGEVGGYEGVVLFVEGIGIWAESRRDLRLYTSAPSMTSPQSCVI